ncbi:MAG: histidine kinase [Burkholderiales bacterium]|nr:histidine kinase [Burkholderiales bacterium]
MGIRERFRRWEARGDAWAAKRLTPEEFAEAAELDRLVRRHPGRLVAGYLAATFVLALLLVGIKPALPKGEALVLANVLIACLGFGLAGVWFGYRRHAGKPVWRTALAITALAAAGAVTGALLVRVVRGTGFGAVGVPELVRFTSIGILTGIVVAAFVMGATWIRTREARAREAAAAAQAEGERLAKRMAEAELKLLQAQVEPHFLFNTLANLRWLVQQQSPDALAMLDHLIDYLRTALPEMRAESSTVGREAALARAYLEILRIRMGGALAVVIDVPEALAPHAFPPLMLMTLVENAVKHGIAPVGRGRIAIRAARAGDRLRLEVEDDGRGPGGEPGNGVGLANVRERLAALHGGRASLVLSPRAGGGATAVIEIPLVEPA